MHNCGQVNPLCELNVKCYFGALQRIARLCIWNRYRNVHRYLQTFRPWYFANFSTRKRPDEYEIGLQHQSSFIFPLWIVLSYWNHNFYKIINICYKKIPSISEVMVIWNNTYLQQKLQQKPDTVVGSLFELFSILVSITGFVWSQPFDWY